MTIEMLKQRIEDISEAYEEVQTSLHEMNEHLQKLKTGMTKIDYESELILSVSNRIRNLDESQKLILFLENFDKISLESIEAIVKDV